MTTLLVNFLGIAVIAFIVYWFWFSKPVAQRATTKGPIDVVVADGTYSPARIEVTASQSATLRFLRRDPNPCAEKVIMTSLDIQRDLPLNQPVLVTIIPPKPGEYEFTCQMGMYRGTIVARAG